MNDSSSRRRFTVTAALPYANGPLHIGHLAGCYLPADIFVRYLRRSGCDVIFVCGSDEHGVPITIKADREGVAPQVIVDRYHQLMENTFKNLNVSFDIYHRTSDPLHHETAQNFFRKLLQNGEIFPCESEEFYDPEANRFLADRYIVGECPSCGFDSAYGDQCERCGRSLTPRELKNPRSRFSASTPVLRKTTHWYIDLGKHQDEWLKEWVLEKENFWKSNVVGQCLSWLGEGENHLKPRAISRDLDWGVAVPKDLISDNKKVLYVWFEAPIGYISATIAYFKNVNPENVPKWIKGNSWEDYWRPDGNSQLVHFIGKDNIVFHCIIFPAMLKAAGNFILPWQVPANEFLNLEGQKISTSRNYAVWVHEYLNDMPGREDELRYVLSAGMPEQKDNNFSWKYDGTDNSTDSYQARVNNELVANLGNFVNRVLVLINKFYDGDVPEPSAALEENRWEQVQQTLHIFQEALEQFRFRDALGEIMKLSSWGNRFLQRYEPWKTTKSQPNVAATALFECTQLVAALALFCEPFMPRSSSRILKMLNISFDDHEWDILTQKILVPRGHKINKPEILFRKVGDEEVDKQINKLKNNRPSDQNLDNRPHSHSDIQVHNYSLKSPVSIEDFKKLNLIVVTIENAEEVPNADRLLKLTINTGSEKRVVLSGIAKYYRPEELIQRQVVFIENLLPRNILGIKSNGMILMAEGKEGKPVFLKPDEPIDPGSPIS